MQPSETSETNEELMQQESRNTLRMIQVVGILHIILSVLILSFGSVVLAEFNLNREINAHATPVWSCFGFITTGILGIVLFYKPQNQGLAICHCVFAMISVVLSLGIIIASADAFKDYKCELETYFDGWYNRNITYYPGDCKTETIRNIGQPVYGMLVGLSALQLIFLVISTILGLHKMYNICGCCRDFGDGCCEGSSNDCNCCYDDQASTSQMYQMQPIDTMGYQAPQQQLNNTQLQFRQQYPNSTYPQQIPNQQINIMPTQQSQIVTNASGQQFVLIPMPQIQSTSPLLNPVNQTVVTATVPFAPIEGEKSPRDQTAQVEVQ